MCHSSLFPGAAFALSPSSRETEDTPVSHPPSPDAVEPESDHGEIGFNWPLVFVLTALLVFWVSVFFLIH